ncbi:hypothetical protein Leryth_025182, partial [Lithospermum erythrorhizon]
LQHCNFLECIKPSFLWLNIDRGEKRVIKKTRLSSLVIETFQPKNQMFFVTSCSGPFIIKFRKLFSPGSATMDKIWGTLCSFGSNNGMRETN